MQKHLSQLDHWTKQLLCLMKGKYKKPVYSEQKVNTLLEPAGLRFECVYVHTTGIKKLWFHCPKYYRLLLILSHYCQRLKNLLLCLEWKWSSPLEFEGQNFIPQLLHYNHDVWSNDRLKEGTWEIYGWQYNSTKKRPKWAFIIISSNEWEIVFLYPEMWWLLENPSCTGTCMTFQGFLTYIKWETHTWLVAGTMRP